MIDILFPLEAHLCVQQVKVGEEQTEIYAQRRELTAKCPTCEKVSHKTHSQYLRHPHDLPCMGHGVQLHLRVRRFFCHNNQCPRLTFAESFPQFLNYKARRTQRLRTQQLAVAFAVSGEEGRRLLQALGMPLSGDTLIREIRMTPEESLDTPRVLGIDDWAMRPDLSQALVLSALQMAIANRQPAAGLLHHSDRGSQYCAHAYRQLQAQHKMVTSMSRKGNCYDNAAMESFFATLKNELVDRRHYRNHAEARRDIFAYIEGFYNRRRRHSTLGFVSPIAFEKAYALCFNQRVH